MCRAKDKLHELRGLAHGIAARAAGKPRRRSQTANGLRNAFVRHMDNDLRLGEAIDAVQSLLSVIKPEALKPDEAADILSTLRNMDKVLNVLF
jgi:cysteinyl-tRNA synthetase